MTLVSNSVIHVDLSPPAEIFIASGEDASFSGDGSDAALFRAPLRPGDPVAAPATESSPSLADGMRMGCAAVAALLTINPEPILEVERGMILKPLALVPVDLIGDGRTELARVWTVCGAN